LALIRLRGRSVLGGGFGRVDGESVTAVNSQNYSKFELTIFFL